MNTGQSLQSVAHQREVSCVSDQSLSASRGRCSIGVGPTSVRLASLAKAKQEVKRHGRMQAAWPRLFPFDLRSCPQTFSSKGVVGGPWCAYVTSQPAKVINDGKTTPGTLRPAYMTPLLIPPNYIRPDWVCYFSLNFLSPRSELPFCHTMQPQPRQLLVDHAACLLT